MFNISMLCHFLFELVFIIVLYLLPSIPRAFRHSFTTRLLFSLLPASWYAKRDASVLGLLRALADDMTSLFQEGVGVSATCLLIPLLFCSGCACGFFLPTSVLSASLLRLPEGMSIFMLALLGAKEIGLGSGRHIASRLGSLRKGSATGVVDRTWFDCSWHDCLYFKDMWHHDFATKD